MKTMKIEFSKQQGTMVRAEVYVDDVIDFIIVDKTVDLCLLAIGKKYKGKRMA